MQKYKLSRPQHKNCEIVISRINTEQISTSRPVRNKKYQFVLPIKHEFPVKVLNQSMNIPVSLHKAPLAQTTIEEINVNPWSTSEIKIGEEDIQQFHL